MKKVSPVLFAVSVCSLSHLLAELKTSSEMVGQDTLKFLEVIKREKPGSGNIAASANDIQKAIRQLERLAGVSCSMSSLSLSIENVSLFRPQPDLKRARKRLVVL